jgi:hypothetical protein
VFASIDLINDQWIDTPESDIKISSTWRVFEISSGDVEEVGNYGERIAAPRSTTYPKELILLVQIRLTYDMCLRRCPELAYQSYTSLATTPTFSWSKNPTLTAQRVYSRHRVVSRHVHLYSLNT